METHKQGRSIDPSRGGGSSYYPVSAEFFAKQSAKDDDDDDTPGSIKLCFACLTGKKDRTRSAAERGRRRRCRPAGLLPIDVAVLRSEL